jgi:hypothetical protein
MEIFAGDESPDNQPAASKHFRCGLWYSGKYLSRAKARNDFVGFMRGLKPPPPSGLNTPQRLKSCPDTKLSGFRFCGFPPIAKYAMDGARGIIPE